MNNSIEIYRSQDGSIQLNVKLENDTVWLTQSQMAELFGVDRTSIVRHIRNIYKSEELDQNSTCAKNAQVRTEGHRSILREIPYYNLDMIISVGYRVNSKNATSFRRWATSVLKQYLIKGYAINQQISAALDAVFVQRKHGRHMEDYLPVRRNLQPLPQFPAV